MKIRYIGLSKAVQIAATRQWAAHGEVVEVESKVARELVKQDSWEKVTVTEEKEKDDG